MLQGSFQEVAVSMHFRSYLSVSEALLGGLGDSFSNELHECFRKASNVRAFSWVSRNSEVFRRVQRGIRAVSKHFRGFQKSSEGFRENPGNFKEHHWLSDMLQRVS